MSSQMIEFCKLCPAKESMCDKFDTIAATAEQRTLCGLILGMAAGKAMQDGREDDASDIINFAFTKNRIEMEAESVDS